ncbi:transcription factor Zn C2H2 [Pyrenophora seminiperda CCB06]|uniref:Transcription factor Zn C2H2 n=1 Tax=Pyrenophora seminiperda CCB06 TaxID=1302712 RepID=A0A3M7MEG2_9PLEO|nr:transcription factor Zn C2H2 [Pyrenophora seminiperda CCB06]
MTQASDADTGAGSASLAQGNNAINLSSTAGAWFLQFAGFLYNHRDTLGDNFNRLAKERKWGNKLNKSAGPSVKLKKRQAMSSSQANSWFIQFAGFTYYHSETLGDNFNRLAKERKWGYKLEQKRWAQCQAEEFSKKTIADVSSQAEEPSSITRIGTSSQAGSRFLQFAGFTYDPSETLEENVHRLATERKWGDKLTCKRLAEFQADTSSSITRIGASPQAGSWFCKFLGFKYDPSEPREDNFKRLAALRKWGDKLKCKHWTQCQAEEPSSHIRIGASPDAGSWFLNFPSFAYDYSLPLEDNFSRLAASHKWDREEKRKHWAECQIEEFGNAYGTDTTKLENWQNLCREVRIDEPMPSITQCKKALNASDVLVNLENLINHRNMPGVEVIRFNDWEEFMAYTVPDRIFAKKMAKKEGFIPLLGKEKERMSAESAGIVAGRTSRRCGVGNELNMLHTPRAWSLLVVDDSSCLKDYFEEEKKYYAPKECDRDYIEYVIARNMNAMEKAGDKRVTKEELLEKITPLFQGYYDMSLTMDHLYEASTQDCIQDYQKLIQVGPMLILRDMAMAADQEADRQAEEYKERVDTLAGMLDFATKVHEETAAATLRFLDGLGFALDPKIQNLRRAMEDSRRVLGENLRACVEAGWVTKENTSENDVSILSEVLLAPKET